MSTALAAAARPAGLAMAAVPPTTELSLAARRWGALLVALAPLLDSAIERRLNPLPRRPSAAATTLPLP
eukprot:6599278-Prymnesium_polylepis.1